MGKLIIHFVRHAQGYHSVPTENYLQIPDPDLTPFGVTQCEELTRSFPYHPQITHLMSSPIRRALYTCLYSFSSAVDRGLRVLALPSAQEFSDTGSPAAKLAEEFGDKVDLGLLNNGWNSNSGKWSPNCDVIEARAREARARETRRFLLQFGKDWLQEDGNSGRDCHIVVTTHGGFLHYLTEEWSGTGSSAGKGWRNCEFRSFTFAKEEHENACLVELQESRATRPEEKVLSKEQHRALRSLRKSSGSRMDIRSCRCPMCRLVWMKATKYRRSYSIDS